MKLYRFLPQFVLGIVVASCVSCAAPSADGTPASPAQQAITAATNSYKALDSAILAADAAVRAGTLKGNDAATALRAFTQAKTGLDVGLVALRNANAAAAASGASK